MRSYDNGPLGLHVLWGFRASVFPRALLAAVPNAAIAAAISYLNEASSAQKDLSDSALTMMGGFTSVLFFVLYLRNNVAYNRWWEGGTLLQQVRGEWFNAYSSLLAFTSHEPSRAADVEAYHHMLARLMSLLFCSALQQVSPTATRRFEILDWAGLDPSSMEFLAKSSDKVEVILQWIQRSTILNMLSGVLPTAPPIMSRAFQEISRGVVNLQNARKIADFPIPYPYAQIGAAMLIIHWSVFPIMVAMSFSPPIAASLCFGVVFFLWCVHFTALCLEHPFGLGDNDLPMEQMQREWNKSLATLLTKRGASPPKFMFDPQRHRTIDLCFSDGIGQKRRTITKMVSSMISPRLSAVGLGSCSLFEESGDDDNAVVGKTQTWQDIHNYISADHRDSGFSAVSSRVSKGSRGSRGTKLRVKGSNGAAAPGAKPVPVRTMSVEVDKDPAESLLSDESQNKASSVRFAQTVETANASWSIFPDANIGILNEREPLDLGCEVPDSCSPIDEGAPSDEGLPDVLPQAPDPKPSASASLVKMLKRTFVSPRGSPGRTPADEAPPAHAGRGSVTEAPALVCGGPRGSDTAASPPGSALLQIAPPLRSALRGSSPRTSEQTQEGE